MSSLDGDRTLQDTFELRGEFWLPGDPADRVAGTVTCTPDRIELSLLGAFGGPLPFAATEQLETILGATEGGPCTLVRVYSTGHERQMFGGELLARSRYTPTFLFVGELFESEADLLFSEMSFGFEGLEEWMGESPFKTAMDGGATGAERVRVARHVYPEDFEVRLGSDAATLSLSLELGQRKTLRTFQWTQRIGLNVRPDEACDFSWFERQLQLLRGLLSLLFGEPVVPTRITGVREGDQRRHVQVFFPLSGRSRKRTLHPWEMLFSRTVLGDRLEDVCSRWFERQEVLNTTASLFFGTLYAGIGAGPLEFHFLTLTQALESFHRRIHGGRYLPEAEYEGVRQALVATIPSGIPRDLRDVLKARLKYGNDLSQRRRLKELVLGLSGQGRTMIDRNGDFVLRVVEQRNYLTHYEENPSSPPMDVQTMYEYVVRLRALLTLLLLAEIGIGSDEAAEAVGRTRWFRGLLLSGD